jgi:glutamyl-tRNA(Gln) amidotransferase subunit E
MPEEKLKRIKSDYSLNDKLARQVLNSVYAEFFEELAKGGFGDPTLIAVTLTETLKSLERDGILVNNLNFSLIKDVFSLVSKGMTAKESIPELLTWLSSNTGQTVETALNELGLGMMSLETLKKLVQELISENRSMIEKMGMRSFGPLMGIIMKEVRGKAQAEDVKTILKQAIEDKVHSLENPTL